MWNPFRRRADRPFPRPEWPPIQSLDSIDITGVRRDGSGVDLLINASQPLDDAPDTLERIRVKVRNYLLAAAHSEQVAEWGHPRREQVVIVIHCKHPIHPAAMAVIEECRAEAASQGVRLELENPLG